ncbi:hypothetical protein DUI87_05830 [Hirundo rustica rustica]|uniref:Uncharacterized protein n=1 Tax=Hirundo rustica rustica TaxID=333673 RepID=A0A3M0KVC3_HIRRU|nr:hypothetical protein DUI87_05830 [Hirundo rustica rustica]
MCEETILRILGTKNKECSEVLAEEKEWSKLKLELNLARDTKNKKASTEKGIKNMLGKFADDTKLSDGVDPSERWDDNHSNLDKLKKGGMSLARPSDGAGAPGSGQPLVSRLGDEKIQSNPAKKDLGVLWVRGWT